MEKVIAINEFYSLAVDLEKQRLYVELKGQWMNLKLLNSFMSDAKESAIHFFDTYSCITDLTGLMPFNERQAKPIAISIVGFLTSNSMRNSAQILPESHEASQQVISLVRQTGKVLTVFGDKLTAEMYLDSHAS
ncbi:hypothetical protein R9C00_22035 [Flammeovirgaceae bacterium SG7u.111]|nr:hypothetical protein [Flammeovirgaceae bacterium SG7u.132]WPO34384.1 hypothetical protein R9C00_22035 [Flammeovirgaceae bacterium SG7u.111]